ncbi:hypothetical protein CRI77_16070 [Mycolicibacterium duvalii]|uniref:Uncharacterized protein n=1 Tax=Mycolicibacterium duvalii TaxID=39688 RepID=A0A7I7K3K5_9MYCO|nr:hypothetical protein [Mycolicibacterium duvalii]MCV7367753.1 hypothetical protein [Mycolicibacterium duvalii]PEG39422.1 hypothetical protein CRI77_16070 [Mycolicibacterium duvalii]BBX18657.1 hypothetical protein MDUV_35170 [Mycolicibacterium duvalii]
MIAGIGIAAWLTIGYAAVLVAIAYGIDTFARRAAAKVEQHRSGAFVYHEDHDAWQCPQDQWLWPTSFDPDNRVMRYRGRPAVCNACPVKHTCTSSHDGREMSRAVDSWPASESARFHRGIACAVGVIAVVLPLATALAAGTAPEALLLVGSAAVAGAATWPLWSHLRRTPAVPVGVTFQTLDDNLEDRKRIAENESRRRTSYASDRREVR